MIINKLRNKFLLYGLSFVIPFFVMVCVFLLLKLTPFGNNNLLVSDLGTQYSPFLTSFKRFFEQGDMSSLYSFSNGIGGSTEALIAYYLMSPLNFFVLLFPYDMIPIAISCLIMLKISLMGLTMYTYLDKHYNQTSVLTQGFSLAYSLCGFVVVYLFNFMWLDVLIIFPILVLGIERLWHRKKYGLYAVALFSAIVTNYYLGYMVCIFSVAYSVFLYYYYIYKPKPIAKIKQFWQDWCLFLTVSFLAGTATSFMLIPAVNGMLKTGKSTFYLHDFLPIPKFGLEALSQMAIGTINFETRLDHLPMVYSGIFIWLLAFIYFFLPTVPKRKKKAMAGLLIFVYFSFFFEMFNTVWHMFQSPAGFPYRNAFIFSFILIKLAYETYLYARIEQDKDLIKKRVLLAGVVYTILLSIGQLFLNMGSNHNYLLSNIYFIISVAIIWLFVLLITVGLIKSGTVWHVLLMICIMAELGGNLWLSLKDTPFGQQKQYEEMYNQQEKVIQNMMGRTNKLNRFNHRVDNQNDAYNEVMNGYNNPVLFGYPGVSSYTSTLEANTQHALVDLGLYAKNDRRISYVDESQLANLLLNVRYTIVPKELDEKKVLHKDKLSYTYLNDEAVGMGFTANPDLANLEFNGQDIIGNQEKIMQTIAPQKTEYFDSLRDLQTSQKNKKVMITGVTQSSGTLYLYLPRVVWNNVGKLKLNDKVIDTYQYIATNQLFNLGYVEKDMKLELTFNSNVKADLSKMAFKTLNAAEFQHVIDKAEENHLELDLLNRGKLKGTVTVNEPNQLLYIAIPFDKDWTIKVDGKKTRQQKILDDFIGIPITKGKHTIEMSYSSKALTIGVIVSLFTIVMSGVAAYYFKKRSR
ncbi:YfhO family protein [Vagococcus vulneris]|uniref:Copper ABC transporter permease n=1 Tax=Vagococcus vulneris TaxID=1977869 RepID=A0A429ZYV2_9ENTE|nr:YfhO family protein [Vagococcus vulneris]RST99145.1 hypothetical protein CBF37_05620 [Vagococcus vulneris]